MSDFYKGLMDEVKSEEMETLAKLMEEFDEKRSKVFEDFANRKKAVQAACPHDRTRKVNDFDYHKREEWVETYCSDCGKMLSRV